MTTPQHPSIAESILKKEDRKRRAAEVLKRPVSPWIGVVVLAVAVNLGPYLANSLGVALPLWVVAVLSGLVALTVSNTVDLWTTRRRLEAAITLLQLQQDANERP